MMRIIKGKIKPIFLFADSQLLFYTNEEGLFLQRIKKFLVDGVDEDQIKAAYIGASNDDITQYYEIFKLALPQINIRSCRMIKSNPMADDNEFLKNADIILLAGGDIVKGWNTLQRNGWDNIIIERYSRGATLIGISAGAIHLEIKGSQEFYGIKVNTHFDTLQLAPFIVDVHADDLWQGLTDCILSGGNGVRGIGIPKGAGLVYEPDGSIQSIRFPCIELLNTGNGIKRTLIQPVKGRFHSPNFSTP